MERSKDVMLPLVINSSQSRILDLASFRRSIGIRLSFVFSELCADEPVSMFFLYTIGWFGITLMKRILVYQILTRPNPEMSLQIAL